MKKDKLIGIILFSIFFAAPLFADDCSDALSEAKKKYNAGSYSKAKELFEYVQEECGVKYGSADQWIMKCNEALKQSQKRSDQSSSTTLTASKTQINAPSGNTTEYIFISSNKSWSISTYPESWCQVSKTNSELSLTISPNPNINSRSTYIQIATSDNKKNLTISVSQDAKTQTTGSSSATLSLSKTTITASASGTTEYITVTSDRNWEIEYPSATMYSVTKQSETIIRVVINRNTGGNRQDFFNIKTTDGSKTVKVNLSQGKGSSTSSTKYSSSSYRSSYSGYSALSDFNDSHGKWEIDWVGIRMGLGTGLGNDYSLLAFRYSVLKVEPVVLGLKYDFIESYGSFYYQPDIKLVFPWNSDWAVEFGVGPSIQVNLKRGRTNAWFTTEVGVLYHWGGMLSSDFFMRYDGIFSIGASINFSTGF